MALAAGQRAQHLRNFAAAVLSSVSSQLSSTPSAARSPDLHRRHQNGRASSGAEETSCPTVTLQSLTPNSSEEDDDPQSVTQRFDPSYLSGVTSGSGLAQSLSPVAPWAHNGRDSPPRSGQLHGQSLSSSSWVSRHDMQSSMDISQGRGHRAELGGVRIWYNPRRFHMGHAHHHHEGGGGGGGPDKSGKANERILGWGLWSDICLAVGKGGAGYVSGSTALIADAAHSVSDVVSALSLRQ